MSREYNDRATSTANRKENVVFGLLVLAILVVVPALLWRLTKLPTVEEVYSDTADRCTRVCQGVPAHVEYATGGGLHACTCFPPKSPPRHTPCEATK